MLNRSNPVIGILFLSLAIFTYLQFVTLKTIFFNPESIAPTPTRLLIPQPLPDTSINTAKGTTIRDETIEFETPWEGKPTITRKAGITHYAFPGGQVVFYFRQTSGLNKPFFSYQHLRKILFTVPRRITLFTPSNQTEELSITLLFKEIQLDRCSAVYEFSFHEGNGFEKVGQGKEPFYELDLYPSEHGGQRLMIAGPVTQPDLNRIIQTFHWIPAAPNTPTSK